MATEAVLETLRQLHILPRRENGVQVAVDPDESAAEGDD